MCGGVVKTNIRVYPFQIVIGIPTARSTLYGRQSGQAKSAPHETRSEATPKNYCLGRKHLCTQCSFWSVFSWCESRIKHMAYVCWEYIRLLQLRSMRVLKYANKCGPVDVCFNKHHFAQVLTGDAGSPVVNLVSVFVCNGRLPSRVRRKKLSLWLCLSGLADERACLLHI